MEKIDQLRGLLDDHRRDTVSMHTLEGIVELPGGEIKTYVRTGDRAVIFIGPSKDLDGLYTENKDGTVTVSFTFPGAKKP